MTEKQEIKISVIADILDEARAESATKDLITTLQIFFETLTKAGILGHTQMQMDFYKLTPADPDEVLENDVYFEGDGDVFRAGNEILMADDAHVIPNHIIEMMAKVHKVQKNAAESDQHKDDEVTVAMFNGMEVMLALLQQRDCDYKKIKSGKKKAKPS